VPRYNVLPGIETSRTDGNLVFNQELVGKSVAIFGAVNIDGYGVYSLPTDVTPPPREADSSYLEVVFANPAAIADGDSFIVKCGSESIKVKFTLAASNPSVYDSLVDLCGTIQIGQSASSMVAAFENIIRAHSQRLFRDASSTVLNGSRINQRPGNGFTRIEVIVTQSIEGVTSEVENPTGIIYRTGSTAPAQNILRFGEPYRITSEDAARAILRGNNNVGPMNELFFTHSEVRQNGASNILISRIDFTWRKDKLGKLWPVLASTGTLPQEMLDAIEAGTYVPSRELRSLPWVNATDKSSAQVHKDPTGADIRYWAIGKAMDLVQDAEPEAIVFATAPSAISASHAVMNPDVRTYPVRRSRVSNFNQDVIDAILDPSLAVMDNPNLSYAVYNTAAEGTPFASLESIGISNDLRFVIGDKVSDGDEFTFFFNGSEYTVKALKTLSGSAPVGTLEILLSSLGSVVAEALEVPAHVVTTGGAGEIAARVIARAINEYGASVITGLQGGAGVSAYLRATVLGRIVTLTTRLSGYYGVPSVLSVTNEDDGGFLFERTALWVDLTVDTDAGDSHTIQVGDDTITVTALGLGNEAQVQGQYYSSVASAASAINASGPEYIIAYPLANGTAVRIIAITAQSTTGQFTVDSAPVASTLELYSGSDLLTVGGTQEVTMLPYRMGAVKRNFGHLMAGFCWGTSLDFMSCFGHIGLMPMDKNLDGSVTIKDLQDWIGVERRHSFGNVIDDANGAVFADNGVGVLGFDNMREFDGSKAIQSNPGTPYGYAFWATARLAGVDSWSEVHLPAEDPNYADTALRDSRNRLVDLGAYIMVFAEDIFFSGGSASSYDSEAGSYITNAAAVVAGLRAVNDERRSLTLHPIDGIGLLRPKHPRVRAQLNKLRFATLQNTGGGIKITDGVTGAYRISDNAKSDYDRQMVVDIVARVHRTYRQLIAPELGKALNVTLRNAITKRIQDYLATEIKEGYLIDATFRFEIGRADTILNRIRIIDRLVAPSELRNVIIDTSLDVE